MASSVGTGPTELAAFDDALLRIGVGNFNLVRLSSVIPPASRVEEGCRRLDLAGGWGDRLYTVYAARCASRRGDEAWAGLGWAQDRSGRGVFVEHEGDAERQVRAELDATLEHLRAARALRPAVARTQVVGTAVADAPVCALVLCAYATEPWWQAVDLAAVSRSGGGSDV